MAEWNWEAVRSHCHAEASRHARSEAEADDITQEALLRAWRMRRSCRNPEQPWGWLREIARNEAHRMLSRRAATHELPTDPLPDQSAPCAEEPLLARLNVAEALSALSPTDRLLVRLRYEADLTHPSIARLLGISVANVKVRLHRLRPKLRQDLPEP
jgi:RNA polymerase sigma-70 factor, ECF subfamily